MSNVWKVGSRWSSCGSAESCIINIFRRSGYVFVGTKGEQFQKAVRINDYIAIADGFTIMAVAKVLDEHPTDLCDLILQGRIKLRESDCFSASNPEEYRGWCYGIRVHIVDLDEGERFQYKKQGTFFAANQIWDKVIQLYENGVSQKFNIASGTYRLRKTRTEKDSARYPKYDLLNSSSFYRVPIYQREYSWSEEQVGRFLRDIFIGFWGAESNQIINDPLFIGTMQLSQRRFVSEHESEQDIIDGQQRISTLLCLLKYLSIQYPDTPCMKLFQFNWLETQVNNGKEDYLLRELCSLTDVNSLDEHSPNVYIRNAGIIKSIFQQSITNDDGSINELFSIDLFLEYLLNDIYFVVVETVAGLSKTIQIFNTINTAGLNLNGDDLFKVRFYEYLHDKCGASEDAFNNIGEVYKRIKAINEEWRITNPNEGYDVVSMASVRDAYKDYIISKYDLNNGLYQMATDTFFECMFDILLNIQAHKDKSFGANVLSVSLSLEDLNRVVDCVADWNRSGYMTPDQLISYKLIEKSRYSRYCRVVYLLLLNGFSMEQVYSILKPLSRVYLCHSVYNSKVINEIHTFTFHLEKRIGSGQSFEEVLQFIKQKLDDAKEWAGHFRKWIFGNRIWQDLICCLSAYLDEIENPELNIYELNDKLSWGYDIEHIHANADGSMEVAEEQLGLQNSIGNLVLLEYEINRSIQNIPFEQKVNRSDGKLCYRDSKYASIAKIRKNQQWGIIEMQHRLENEYNRIMRFIWD